MDLNFKTYDGETGVTVVLTALPGASGSPAPSYAATEVSPTLYAITIPQNLTGEWGVVASNGAGDVIFTGYWTAGTPRCYDFTLNSPGTGIEETLQEILNKTNLIGTTNALVPTTRLIKQNLTLYVAEDQTVTIISADYTSRNIRFIIESTDKINIATLENADITKTSTSISFAMPDGVTDRARALRYALRDSGTNELLATGTLQIIYAPVP